ncbi:MAG: NmrA family NAD(P)-binding protein [Pseudobdellovibrionaceae bacterium]
MILVMGATGHIGSKITTHLLGQGQKVRCLARRFPNKETFSGAELAQGDANNVSFLVDAMRGCSAVFTMIPPNITAPEMRFYQNKLGEVIAEAIEESNIKKVVNLSSIGADLESGTGPVLGLRDQEQRLNSVTRADIIHLRPTYFMENLLNSISSIISMNCYFGTIPADVPCPMIATRDIAAKAAFLLMNPTFKSQSVEYLLGERDLTHREIVRVLGQAIGKPELEYVEVPNQEMKNYFLGAGMSEDGANGLLEMSESFGKGIITATVKRTRANTTTTSIEEFARTTFLDAYRKGLALELQKKQGFTTAQPPPEAQI